MTERSRPQMKICFQSIYYEVKAISFRGVIFAFYYNLNILYVVYSYSRVLVPVLFAGEEVRTTQPQYQTL